MPAVHDATRSAAWRDAWLAYALLGGVVCFAWLGTTDVVSMEGIVADGARHMQRSGDFLVPHLYGEMYNYKPALVYWMALASTRVLGESEWSLRLPGALCAFVLGAAILVTVGRLLDPRRACVCAVAALTGAIFVQKSRLAEFDTPLAAGLGVAICAALYALIDGRRGWLAWPTAYAALAFAFLAKGIPALMLFGPGLLAAALLLRRWRELLRPWHLAGVALFVLIAGAYVALVWRSHGVEAFRQAFAEAQSRGSQWSLRAVGLTLLKPAIIAAVLIPWSPMLLLLLDRSWRMRLPDAERRLLVGAGAFLVAGVAAFMIVPTLETRYFVPLSASLAMVAGLIATSDAGTNGERWGRSRELAARLTALGVGVAAVVLGVVAVVIDYRKPQIGLSTVGALLIVSCGVTTLLAAAGRLRTLARPASLLICCGLCVWAFQTFYNTPKRAADRSLRGVADALRPHIPAGERVYVDFDDDHSSLVYYLGAEARWFRREQGWPPPGATLIVFSDGEVDQLAELRAHTGGVLDECAAGSLGRWHFTLCRIRSAPLPSSLPRDP